MKNIWICKNVYLLLKWHGVCRSVVETVAAVVAVAHEALFMKVICIVDIEPWVTARLHIEYKLLYYITSFYTTPPPLHKPPLQHSPYSKNLLPYFYFILFRRDEKLVKLSYEVLLALICWGLFGWGCWWCWCLNWQLSGITCIWQQNYPLAVQHNLSITRCHLSKSVYSRENPKFTHLALPYTLYMHIENGEAMVVPPMS